MNPTASLRALGFRLRKFRAAHQNSKLGDAAKVVSMATSSMSRAEAGKQALNPVIVERLLDYYEVTDAEERAQCLELARQGRKRGWWVRHGDLMNVVYIGLEDGASGIWCLETAMVPGLLQTPDYFRALASIEMPAASNEELERRAAVRLERQAILDRADAPPEIQVILDESVLHRIVGTPAIMAEQLDHLVRMASRPNVEIQILPFDEGAYAGLASRFTVLRFTDSSDPGTVYLEQMHWQDSFVEEAVDVAKFVNAFGRTRAAAISPSRSIGMIGDARDNLRKQGKD
ncbi:DUF5753 domain-containing protein [Phytomonospora sp. NPDC050363]|uniref:DUF5753 domain-containing protein n=1 Tax=Phytomonospora sp. NPDC050363 TaxID=3155642 RepID=UPI0033DEC003